jgi:hypothetical protein
LFFSTLFLFFSVSPEQFSAMENGIIQQRNILEAQARAHTIKATLISKELVQLFSRIISLNPIELVPLNIVRCLTITFETNMTGSLPLFSWSLNYSFLRIMNCRALVTPSVVGLYAEIISRMSVERKQFAVDCGAWPVMIDLVSHENAEVVKAVGEAVKHLEGGRGGGDYGRFIEEGWFEALMKQMPPPPKEIILDTPRWPTSETHSAPFEACGWTWFAPLGHLLSRSYRTPDLLSPQDGAQTSRQWSLLYCRVSS